MDDASEKSGRSADLTEYNPSEHDPEKRYLFDDWSTSECSILSDFGWTRTPNLQHHHRNHYSIDDPFSDFATAKSEASSGSGVVAPPAAKANTSGGGSGLAEQVSISNPSVSSSSSDQDPVEKSIGSGETPPPSLQIPNKKKGKKRIQQQRFAFATKSEIDHLEDGYRWRKYGQKAVKNSPYPRSYYRCTNTKCTVKKRVERSCEDPTTVITTYEGQHCHHTVGFPRGSGLRIGEATFGGQMGPPNSQYYHPITNLPQQTPPCSIAPIPQPALDPASEPIGNSGMTVFTEPQLPPTAQFPSDEGLLGDIVSPRRRNSHP